MVGTHPTLAPGDDGGKAAYWPIGRPVFWPFHRPADRLTERHPRCEREEAGSIPHRTRSVVMKTRVIQDTPDHRGTPEPTGTSVPGWIARHRLTSFFVLAWKRGGLLMSKVRGGA
jgi:hypothetical protein